MDQERNDSRQNPSISRGHNGQNSRRDEPFDNKDITNRRKCPDCDGRLSKESTKSKSRVWKKVMWFTRRSKVSKNDICHCQTGDAFIINSNVEDRHSNSWSFSRSASRKFRISSRKRQCKSESSKKSLYVQGRQDEACSSHESSLSTSQRVSICSSGASSPTATGSFCDFGASSHAGGRGSKRHKNTFVLTEIAREINPPVWNDDLKLSGFNHKPKQLTKSSSTVSHLSRQFVSPTTGNVRRSKSFPGSQSHMSPPKRRFTSTPNTTFVTSSPPVKQKCYGLRRTATYCGKLNTEFPKLCMKKSKSVNSGELTKHGKSTSLGEIRDQSGSVVGIVHFYKSPKRLARKVGSFNREVKKDYSVFEEEDYQCPTVDETSSDASLQSSTTCLSTDSTIFDTQHDVGLNVNQDCSSSMTTLAAVTENVKSTEEIIACEPSSMTADKSFSSTLLSKGEMTNISNLQSVSKTSEVLQGDSGSSNDYCEQNLLAELHVPSSVASQQSSENVECEDCVGARDYHHGNQSDPELHPLLPTSAEQTFKDVDLTCCHNNHMSNDCHVCGHCNTNHLTEPPSSERTSEDVELPYEYGDSVSGECNGNQPSTEHESLETLEDFELKTEDVIVSNESEHPANDPCEVQVMEQLDNLSAPGEDDFVFCNDAKTNHNCPCSVCEEDLSSETFDNQFSAVATPIVSNERFQSHVHSNMITNTETKLNGPTISIKSASDPVDLYKESEPNRSCENSRNLAEPVMAREEFKIRRHSGANTSPEVLESSKTSDYISLFDESFSETDVPIHTWKTSESDLKSEEVGLPVPGETFKRRTELMLSWFEEFNDEQRNIILKKILNRCELPQMHLLSVAMENNLHKTCPPNCQDMLVWLPYTVTLKILMYLDPVSLCRCNQVNRAWNELSDSSLLWQRLTRSPDYQLSEASSKRQYQKFTQANGEIHWKKIFAERFLLQRNWLNGKYKLRTFEGHNQGIACVQFDDTRIVSGSSDKTIKLWDISNTPSELMLTLEGHSGTVRCLDLNGNRLVSGSTDRTIKVWDLSFASYWAGASCKVTMVGHLHTVRCLQADEKKLVSGSYDKTVKVWDLKNGECQLTLRGHTAAVLCVQFDDQKIVSGSYDKKIKVWDLKEGTCLMTLDGHQDAVTCLNLTHDGMKIITGSLDYSLKFWDLSTGKCYGTLDWITSEGHTAVVRCLQVDSWRIVSGGDDKTLKVWELATGQRLLTLRYHSDGVTCMQFNDFAIVSGSYDRTVKLWDFTPKHPYLEAVT